MPGKWFRQVQVRNGLLCFLPRCEDLPKIQFVLLRNEMKGIRGAVFPKLTDVCAETRIRWDNHCLSTMLLRDDVELQTWALSNSLRLRTIFGTNPCGTFEEN